MRTSRTLVATVLSMTLCPFSQSLNSDYRYMEYPHVLPGKVLKVHKKVDAELNRIILEVENGDELTVQDMLAAELKEWEARRLRLGNFSESLADRLLTLQEDETIAVVVKLKMRDGSYLDKTRHAQVELDLNSKAVAALGPVISIDEFLLRYGLSPIETHGENGVVCQAAKSQLQALKTDPDVAEVSIYHNENILSGEPEFSTLASSGYNPGPVPSGAGSGVKAATFEYGLTSTFLSCLGVSATWDAFTGTDDSKERHGESTFKTLVHSAPSATFFHRNSQTFDGTNDVNYIINNGVQTLSMSLSRGGTSPNRSTYSEFLTMDDFAYRSPYPVFANPAGNSGYAYEVNWQCYNAISVGNVRNTSNTTFEMADCTQTKNPPPVYGSCISGSGADCAGDREMPHVVAPGIPYTGTIFATTCLDGSGSSTCGTSYSAPVVNGMAADVIAADSRLIGWPEKVRATIILTAQNVESGDWTVSGDERDGTGTVSGSEAVSFASSHTSVSPGNTAVEKGMTANSFYAADFSANKRFYFLVPNPKPANKHLRVVLTWDSNPCINAGTNNLSDLDLIVQKNGGTASSASYDSNVEVVDVAAADLTAGSTYYIDISPFANRIPASGSRTNFFYYALAWEFVKDHAP